MESVLFAFLASFVAVFALVGNGVVCYVINRRTQLHTPANRFVFSLAVADFGVGLTSIPYTFLCEVGDGCQHLAVAYLHLFFLFASITNLCCMVAERYVSVVWSLRYASLITKKRAVGAIAVAWIFPTLWWLFLLLSEHLVDSASRKKIQHAVSIIDLLIFVVVPSLFLSLATAHMIATAWRLSRQRLQLVAQLSFNSHQESASVVTPVNRSAKTTASAAIVTAIVLCFVVCYSIGVYRAFCEIFPCEPPRAVHFISSLLYIINSALNPVVYALLKSDIKAELKRYVCSSRPTCC